MQTLDNWKWDTKGLWRSKSALLNFTHLLDHGLINGLVRKASAVDVACWWWALFFIITQCVHFDETTTLVTALWKHLKGNTRQQTHTQTNKPTYFMLEQIRTISKTCNVGQKPTDILTKAVAVQPNGEYSVVIRAYNSLLSITFHTIEMYGSH